MDIPPPIDVVEDAPPRIYDVVDALVALFTYLPLKDLLNFSLASGRFKLAAIITARTSFKTLIIDDHFKWIRENLEDLRDLLRNAVQDFEVTTHKESDDWTVQPLFAACTKLKTIRLIYFPVAARVKSGNRGILPLNQARLIPIMKMESQLIETVSFVVYEQLDYAYSFLRSFHGLHNLNLFQEIYNPTITGEMDRLNDWLHMNNTIKSIWLPDQYCYDLERIGQQVHTIRIHVDKIVEHGEKLRNLSSLANLTKIRIESSYKNEGTAERAEQLLKEFGLKHGQKLRELHWCCNFRVCKLPDILNIFTNLKMLIIVNYTFEYGKQERLVNLEDGLPWPSHLEKLKCINFIIKKKTFIALVEREALVMLDIYHCELEGMIDSYGRYVDFSGYRKVKFTPLKILLDYEQAIVSVDWTDGLRRYAYELTNQEYLVTTSERVLLLNVFYKKFAMLKGLNIFIEFTGIENPKYWYNLSYGLQPRNTHRIVKL